MKILTAAFILLSLTACDTVDNMKTPSLQNPQSMSADTLCYRAAYAKSNEAVKTEIADRNLDCGTILRSQSPGGAIGESQQW